MSKREKTLALIFALAAAGYGGKVFVYPTIEASVFGIARENDEIAALLTEQEARLNDVEPYRKAYEEFLARTGSTDPAGVESALHAALTRLIGQAGLGNSFRISPRIVSDYRPPGRKASKAEVKLVRFNVTTEGRLDAVVGFVKSCYELPYVLQVTDLKLDPPSRRGRENEEMVKMTASIEALVPPSHEIAQVRGRTLEQPARPVQHADRDYTIIAARKPFSEWQPPPPPPPPPPVRIEPEPVAEAPKAEPPPPPPPPTPVEDPYRDKKYVRMVMMTDELQEVLVVNTRDNSSEYVTLGDKLDGGEVVLVHPLGAAAVRDDGSTRLYPIGKSLADCLPMDEADAAYPEVFDAYESVKEELEPDGGREESEAAEDGTTGGGSNASALGGDEEEGEEEEEEEGPGADQPGTAVKKGEGAPAVVPAPPAPAKDQVKERPEPKRQPHQRARDQRRRKDATPPSNGAKKGEGSARPATGPGSPGSDEAKKPDESEKKTEAESKKDGA